MELVTDLIGRYLHAVKPFLPRAQQDDILAELSEDLRSQIEEREGELGRKLNEDEVAAIIKKRGLPILVAGGYLPRQHLIGPAWFPAYRFVLKLVLLWILPPIFVLIVAPVLYFTAPNPNSALLDMVRGLPEAAITTFGIITLIFACLDRYQFHVVAKSLENWDPRKLPPVPVAARIQPVPRSVAIGELVAAIVCTLGWVYVARLPYSFDFDIVRLTLAPVWRNDFWPILLLLMSGIPAGCIGLLRPAWGRLHSSFRLIIHGGTLILMGVLFKAGAWIETSSATLPAAQVREIARGYNLGVRIAFVVVSIVVLVEIIQEVLRIFRVKTMPWTANGLAASIAIFE
jgi:hypothetical protein